MACCVQDKLLRVISTEVAKRSYKHILWLGEYMMFEFVPENGSYILKLGVASYTEYRKCIIINETDAEQETDRLENTLVDKCCGKVCMMIPTKMFLDVKMYEFLLQYTILSKTISKYTEDLQYLTTYEHIMTQFVPFYIKPLYQESLEYVGKRFKKFREFHPDLFVHNKTDSCLYSFVPSKTANSLHPETMLFESPLSQITTKHIPPLIKQQWNNLHSICKNIQQHITIYITNCTNPEFHANNLPFFDFSPKTSIRVQLTLVVEIISKCLCGAYAKFLSTEANFLRAITAQVTIDICDAYNIIRILDSIVYKTMPLKKLV